MRALGIDYGSKRVGVALSDDTKTIATPYVVFPNNANLVSALQEIISKEDVDVIVMGDSHTYRGDPNPVMEEIVEFKERLEKVTTLPVHLESEVLTSVQAARHETDRSLRDASAAALILQSYLDKQKRV
jgi:putative Holliday junction resolvase